jgi:hypothetical protein
MTCTCGLAHQIYTVPSSKSDSLSLSLCCALSYKKKNLQLLIGRLGLLCCVPDGPSPVFFFQPPEEGGHEKSFSLYYFILSVTVCDIFMCAHFTCIYFVSVNKTCGSIEEKNNNNIKIFFSDCAMGNRCGNQTESGGYTFPYRSKQLITDNFNQKCFGALGSKHLITAVLC